MLMGWNGRMGRAREERTYWKQELTAAHAESPDVILVVQCQLSSVEVKDGCSDHELVNQWSHHRKRSWVKIDLTQLGHVRFLCDVAGCTFRAEEHKCKFHTQEAGISKMCIFFFIFFCFPFLQHFWKVLVWKVWLICLLVSAPCHLI